MARSLPCERWPLPLCFTPLPLGVPLLAENMCEFNRLCVKLAVRSELTAFLAKKKPNDEVVLIVRRDGAEMKFKVKLGRRAD